MTDSAGGGFCLFHQECLPMVMSILAPEVAQMMATQARNLKGSYICADEMKNIMTMARPNGMKNFILNRPIIVG